MDGTQSAPKEQITSKADTLSILNRNIQPRARAIENDSDSSGPDTIEILGTPRLPKSQLKKLERQNEKLIQERSRLTEQLRKEQDIINRCGPAASKLKGSDLDQIREAIESLETREMNHMANLEVKLSLVQDAYRDHPNKKRGEAWDAVSKLHAQFHNHLGKPVVDYYLPPPILVADDEIEDEEVDEPIKDQGTKVIQGLGNDQGLMRLLSQVVDGMNLGLHNGAEKHQEMRKVLEDSVDESDESDDEDEIQDNVQHEGSIDLGVEDPFVDAPPREETKAQKKAKKEKKKKRRRESLSDKQSEDGGSGKTKKRKLKQTKAHAGDTTGGPGSVLPEIEKPASAESKSKKNKKNKRAKKATIRKSDEVSENHIDNDNHAVQSSSKAAHTLKSSPFKPPQPTPDAINGSPVKIFPPTNPASEPAAGRKWRFNLPSSFTANLPRFSATALGASPAHTGAGKQTATPDLYSAKRSWIMEGSTGRHHRANNVTMTIGDVSSGVGLSQGSPTEKRRPGRPKGSKTKNHNPKERVPFTGISTTPIPLPAYASLVSQPSGLDLVLPVIPAADASSIRSRLPPPRSMPLPLVQQLERDRAVYEQERSQWFAAMGLPRSPGPRQK